MGIFLMDKDLMSLAATVGIRIMSVLVFLLMSMTAIHPVFQCGWVSMRGRSSLPENYRLKKWALHPGN